MHYKNKILDDAVEIAIKHILKQYEDSFSNGIHYCNWDDVSEAIHELLNIQEN